MNHHPGVLHRISALLDDPAEPLPAARREVLELIRTDPERALAEGFEVLAERSGSSVPTIMRTARDLGFGGLREFKLALAQELAVGGSPLNRRVRIDDDTRQVIAKLTRGAVTVINSVQAQLDAVAVERAADVIAQASRVDCYGVGVTSNFMASDLQARLYRLGLATNSYLDPHLQLISAATIGPQGVVMAITYVGGMPSLLEAVDVARSQGATVIALTQPGSQLAGMSDIVLAVEVSPDPVMPVGPEAYLAHLTVIEILTVLVAQRLGDRAVDRLAKIQRTLETRGHDMRHHSRIDWAEPADEGPNGAAP